MPEVSSQNKVVLDYFLAFHGKEEARRPCDENHTLCICWWEHLGRGSFLQRKPAFPLSAFSSQKRDVMSTSCTGGWGPTFLQRLTFICPYSLLMGNMKSPIEETAVAASGFVRHLLEEREGDPFSPINGCLQAKWCRRHEMRNSRS